MLNVKEDEITVAELDEAIRYISEQLKDRYGNRVTPQRRKLLMDSIDDLLEARSSLTKK
jgi:hypothetical protein